MYRHAAEVGPLPFRRFKPNRKFYDGLEHAGVLDVFTMRDLGKLVGYAVFSTLPNPDYLDTWWCRESCIYVEPDYRGIPAMRFQGFQDRALRGKYPDAEVVRFSTARKDRGAVLEGMGYRRLETAYILDRDELAEVKLA